jgi:hypothetical protein
MDWNFLSGFESPEPETSVHFPQRDLRGGFSCPYCFSANCLTPSDIIHAIDGPAGPFESWSALGMWEDSRCCWVVLCKNHWFHIPKNLFFRHRISLAETDAVMPRPSIKDRFKVRCDECGNEYIYKPSEVLNTNSRLLSHAHHIRYFGMKSLAPVRLSWVRRLPRNPPAAPKTRQAHHPWSPKRPIGLQPRPPSAPPTPPTELQQA